MKSEILTRPRELKAFEKFKALVKPGKNGEFSTKWIFAEEQFEDGLVRLLVRLPVGVCHGELIEI